ncbi:MAG: DUF1565 domain-containing protein [Methanobrevibacter sp.]|nr:DUF1565 domain-containing protein [Methanobrevibacter sp.]
MVYSSLDKLLAKFPYFLKKSSDSNFYKSEYVFNELFKGLYNDLFEVYQSLHLGKRLFVWKEQGEAYNYSVNFIANFPYLKSVTCYKNDEVIYSESYNYSDEVDTFIYSYDGVSNIPDGFYIDEDNESYIIDNEGNRLLKDESKIIPDDTFKIIVETWEEYTLTKCFPENDTIQGNNYDHDESLDEIGALWDIPRKNYNTLTEDDLDGMSRGMIISYYQKTEPSFNDKSTEDDYHYMNRIINYIHHSHDTPLPVLEIWKLYGLPLEEITLTNREKYLCKMFEESRHLNSDGEYDSNWQPHIWEHKDLMCGKEDENIFFFANVNNSNPIQGQSITFNFNFFNEFARKVDNQFYITVYINGELFSLPEPIDTNKNSNWTIPTDDFPNIESIYQFDFTFRAYEKLSDLEADNTNYLESDTIRVMIKGCENADLYVDCVNGNDNNEGTKDKPLRTLTQAINKIQGLNNVIVLLNKNNHFYIENVLKIEDSCSIISCPAGAVIYQNDGWDIFKIRQDTKLYLQNITLKHKCCELVADSTTFTNENRLNYPITVTIPDWVCKKNTVMHMNQNTYNFYAHHSYNVSGVLSTEDTEEPITDETVNLYDSDERIIASTTTNDNGEYSFEHNFTGIGSFNFKAQYEESKKYCNSNVIYTAIVEAMPTTMVASTVDKIFIDDSFTVNYHIKDYYNEVINTGTLKLYEDGVLVKTISNGETLTYKPANEGTYNYNLVYSNGTSYVTSSVQFTISIVKLETSVILLGEGKSIYSISEDIHLTGTILDENNDPVKNATLKLYDNDSVKATLTSNNQGEVSWTGKLAKGTHNLHFEYPETRQYYSSISNSYRVRVRDSELADIKLKLYPEHKILLTKSPTIPLKVFASNNDGNPLRTTFKIWDTYNSSCENNTGQVYTTGDDGWCTVNLPTQAIMNCDGTYLQAVSTVDEDVYSNVAHVVYTIQPELSITGDIFTDESFYSYSDDVIHVNGYLVDEEEDPVPNENIVVNMIVDDATIESKTLTTNIFGEWETTFTTNSTIRGENIKFQIKYNKTTNKYNNFTKDITVEFKQLNTKIITSDMTLSAGDLINITGEILDENNRPVDTGTLNITLNSQNYSKTITDGTFNQQDTDVLRPGTYTVQFKFVENTFYKTSNTTKNITISKVTPVLTAESSHSIPAFESTIIPFSVSRNTRIPLTGNVILTRTDDNSEIASADVNANGVTVLLEDIEEIPCKLTYEGNDYINPVSINITIKVHMPYYIISCNKDSPWDIKLVDNSFPSESSEEYLVLTELTDDYPKLIITTDVDYDTSDLSDDDILIVDTDEEPDILLINEGDEE